VFVFLNFRLVFYHYMYLSCMSL